MKVIVCAIIAFLSGFVYVDASAQVARMVTKASAKVVGKSSPKKVIKVLSKGVLKEIPVGKESLRVIKHADGSFTPAINNLGKNAAKFSDEFNAILLKERRKAITVNYQIISSERLAKTKQIGNLTEGASA